MNPIGTDKIQLQLKIRIDFNHSNYEDKLFSVKLIENGAKKY